MKKTLLAISIASAVFSTSVMATWTAGSQDTVGFQVKDKLQKATTAPVYTLTTALAQNDVITITLTGGATFNVNPTLTPNDPKGDLGGGVALPASPLASAVGKNTATWRVVSTGVATKSTLTLSNAANTYDLTGVANKTAADIQLSVASNGTTIIPNDTLSGAKVVAKGMFVMQDSIAFTTSLGTDQAKAIALYVDFDGKGKVKSSPIALTATHTANIIPNTAFSTGKMLITISGDFSGIKSLTGTGVTAASSTGSIAASTGTNIGTTGAFYIDTANGKAYAVNTAVIAAAGGVLAVSPVFKLDGTTSQGARSFTVSSDILKGETSRSAGNILASKKLYTITRDGTFFTTNSTGPLNLIKITDQSNAIPTAGAAIGVTAYDAAGAKVTAVAGAPALVASLSNNATVTISGADLVANYPTAVRFDVVVNSNDANVSNVKKTASGLTVTTYRQKNGSL